MEHRVKFDFEYDEVSDVLSIFDYDKSVNESIEFNEFINIDIGKKGEISGLEIFDVSKFLSIFNKEVSKNFLKNLNKVELVQADYRNNLFIAIVMYAPGKQIYQQLPPFQKRSYESPLVASA